MSCPSQLLEIEGLCVSPHDFPAKWAAMIYGYFDESGDQGDGYYVVAGFIGHRRDWKKFLPLWKSAIGDHGALHMIDLRLGSSKAPRRYESLLARLGEVPKLAGLKAFSGSVRTADYSQRIAGTVAEIVMKGYPLALCAMIEAVMGSAIPKRDRIEFSFEQQIEFARVRAQAFSYWRGISDYKTHHGLSRIAKESSIEKGSMLLEPADYLAYAVLQRLIDPDSQKARLTAPILDSGGYFRSQHLPGDQANYLLDSFEAQTDGVLFPMRPEAKRAIANRLYETEVID